MQKITTFLWFDTQAEDAVKHHMSIFDNCRIVTVRRYSEAAPRPTCRTAGVVARHGERRTIGWAAP